MVEWHYTFKEEVNMYFNILKKDLKKKKTMNIILFLFTVLASMFVASGLSNVTAVMSGTDYYMEKAGVGDYIIITMKGDGGVPAILDASENVESYRVENPCFIQKTDIRVNGRELELNNGNQLYLIQTIPKDGFNFYLSDNKKLDSVNNGEIYVTAGWLQKSGSKLGDSIGVSLDGKNMEFKIAGEIKDALLGSDMMGNTRLIISEEDWESFFMQESLNPYKGYIYNISTNDESALSSEVSEASNIVFDGSSSVVKLTYIMELIVAMIVLVLSICLIIVSFVILKFVITFSVQEEFREIGVMKAIGIRNSKIRSLYAVKYLFMAVTGGITGFILSLPFGNMLLSAVSEKMVLGNDKGILINVIGAAAVILIMIFFTYLCTGRVKKFTPIDAIRNGQTGERYRKKTVYPLYRAHTKGALYMAVNDILSAPRRFFTIILSFFLCSIFVLGVVMVTDTMSSKNLITVFGKEADVYINDSKLVKIEYMKKGGSEELKESYDKMEKELSDNGMPGQVSMEVWYKFRCEVNGRSYTVSFQQNTETSASDYEYTEGYAPQNADEIAITPAIGKKLGIQIGDILKVDFGEEKRDCMVVGYFQSLNQLGEIIRLHEDAPASMEYASAIMSYQIEFDDNPDEAEIGRRIEWIKDFYGINDVFSAAGYCSDNIGVVDTMEGISKLLLGITCIVVILVTVLMERSFIFDETGQIALLKAVGFKDRTIIKWHICRFMLIGIISEILAAALTLPVTKLWCDPIWGMMGATDVEYFFNPLSILLIYPGVVLAVTLASISVTALYTKKIKSRDIVNIE